MIEGTEMNFRTCAFTGHRPQGMPFGFDEHDPKCAYLIDQIMAIMTNMIINDNVGRFLSGMAIGTDLIAAETTLRLKDVYSWIELECVIPCLNQSSKWAEKFRKRYDDVIRSCARTTLISTEFTKTCMDGAQPLPCGKLRHSARCLEREAERYRENGRLRCQKRQIHLRY